jgi:hypothetical protein
MPNLCRLKVDYDGNINGHEWESFISNNLPKLKKFHFKMEYYFEEDEIIEEQIDQVLNAFRTSFWLVHHGWFVRCDWKPTETSVIFYTLPYAFDSFYIGAHAFLKKSTNNVQVRLQKCMDNGGTYVEI